MQLAVGLGGGGSIAPVPSPSWQANAADATAGMTVNGYVVTRSAAAAAFKGIRGTVFKSTGLWVVSFWPDTASGVEWTTSDWIGLANSTASLTGDLGADDNSIGWLATGLVNLTAGGPTYDPWRTGYVPIIAVNFTSSRAWFRVGGGFWNSDPAANPETNTGGLDISTVTANGPLAPAFVWNTPSIQGRTAAPAPASLVPAGFGAPWGF